MKIESKKMKIESKKRTYAVRSKQETTTHNIS